jgi:hypothetical protein
MTTLTTIIIAVAAVSLALLLAFLPLKFLMGAISRNIIGPVRDFIARQRDRRNLARETPDRRHTG